MGRPPIKGKAMTDAERQRRHRALKRCAEAIHGLDQRIAEAEMLMDESAVSFVTAVAEMARQCDTDDAFNQMLIEENCASLVEGLFEREAWMTMAANPDSMRAALKAERSRLLQEAAVAV